MYLQLKMHLLAPLLHHNDIQRKIMGKGQR